MRKKASRTNQMNSRDTIPPEHNSPGVAGAVPRAKRILGAINLRRDILLLLIGAALSWLGNYYFYQKALRDAEVNKQEALHEAEANKQKALHEAEANKQKALREAEANKDETIAQYVVAAMLPQHPVKDSYELRQRVDRYLDALRRTKADQRGAPVYRADGSIGVDWSINVGVNLSIKSE